MRREKGGNVCLAVWTPATEWEETGSVQIVTMSSAVPVMPVDVVQVKVSGVLPVATITVGSTFVVGFSRQYHNSSTLRLKFEAVPDHVTSRVISLNFPPVQRSGLGGATLL